MAEIQALYAKHGFVSAALINAYSGRTSEYYRRRLGDLQTHFANAGFVMTKRQQTSSANMHAITERRREQGCVLSDDHIVRKLRASSRFTECQLGVGLSPKHLARKRTSAMDRNVVFRGGRQ